MNVPDVTDVFKKIVPARYFSLPACHTVHFDFDSVFHSVPPALLLPMPSPAPARPSRCRPRRQAAPPTVDPLAARSYARRHRPCPRPPPARPAQPRHSPPPAPGISNPPTPLLNATGPLLPSAATTGSPSNEGELTKIHRSATVAITSVGSMVKFLDNFSQF
jgi:hypothetical protein